MALDGIAGGAIDRFEAVNPLPRAALDELSETPFAQALRRSVLQLPRANRPWWRRFVVPVVIVLALGGGATFYSVFARPVTYGSLVLCFGGPTTGAHSSLAAGAQDTAIASCSTLWQSGRFGTPERPVLEECVSARGIAEVFPSRNAALCQRLGLAQPTGGANAVSTSTKNVRALDQTIERAVQSSRCLSLGTLSSTVRHELQVLGLQNWHIVLNGHFAGATPCAGAFVRPPTDTVHVVAQPPRAPTS